MTCFRELTSAGAIKLRSLVIAISTAFFFLLFCSEAWAPLLSLDNVLSSFLSPLFVGFPMLLRPACCINGVNVPFNVCRVSSSLLGRVVGRFYFHAPNGFVLILNSFC